MREVRPAFTARLLNLFVRAAKQRLTPRIRVIRAIRGSTLTAFARRVLEMEIAALRDLLGLGIPR
jgi:hypothetical protein